jgi:hypothetical protein
MNVMVSTFKWAKPTYTSSQTPISLQTRTAALHVMVSMSHYIWAVAIFNTSLTSYALTAALHVRESHINRATVFCTTTSHQAWTAALYVIVSTSTCNALTTA